MVSRQRSIPLSVCPLRVSTPPSRARSGTMCPGRVKSEGFDEVEARPRAVRQRSYAEIPVEIPTQCIPSVKIDISGKNNTHHAYSRQLRCTQFYDVPRSVVPSLEYLILPSVFQVAQYRCSRYNTRSGVASQAII